MVQIINLITDLKYFWMYPYVLKIEASQKGTDLCAISTEAAITEIKLSFAKAHPYIKPEDIPIEMVTPAGDIVDSRITIKAAESQIERVAKARGIRKSVLQSLINNYKIQLSDKLLVDVIQLNAKLNEI